MISFYLAMLDDPEDEAAFISVYDTHLPMLTKAGRRFFKENADVEDALQLTWESVAKNFSRISKLPRHETAPYLVTTMKNKCRDILRNERKYAELFPSEEAVLDDDIDDAIHIKQEYRKAVEAIRKVPDIYREVLERRLILEESNSEIAKAMRINAPLVAKRISRGMAILKERLSEEGDAT